MAHPIQFPLRAAPLSTFIHGKKRKQKTCYANGENDAAQQPMRKPDAQGHLVRAVLCCHNAKRTHRTPWRTAAPGGIGVKKRRQHRPPLRVERRKQIRKPRSWRVPHLREQAKHHHAERVPVGGGGLLGALCKFRRKIERLAHERLLSTNHRTHCGLKFRTQITRQYLRYAEVGEHRPSISTYENILERNVAVNHTFAVDVGKPLTQVLVPVGDALLRHLASLQRFAQRARAP